MMGQADGGLGIAVAKTFSADGGRGLVTIDYALINQGAEPRTVGAEHGTRSHAVEVAGKRVDLPVVAEHAERLSPLP